MRSHWLRLVTPLIVLATAGCAIFGGGWDPDYRVEKGDTLYSIAGDHGLDYHKLAAWNGIAPPYLLEPGQVLRLSPPGGDINYQADSSRPEPASGTGTSDDFSRPLPSVRADPPPDQRSPAPEPVPAASPPVQTAMVSPPSPGSIRWRWPANGQVADIYSPDSGNSGINISGSPGQTIRAAASGKVVYSGSGLQGFGMLIIVKHDDGYLSAYGYNRKLLVKQGDEVQLGQPVAEMGEGPQRKPMLHFEVRRSGKTVDPMLVLPAR
jgi:lipoprotein NlpD